MASAPTLITTLDAAMKVIAEEPLFVDVMDESEFLDIFETDSISVQYTPGGRYIERAHETGLPAGFGSRKENEYLPEADNPEFINSRIKLRKSVGTLEMSGDVMDRVHNDVGGFIDWAEKAFGEFAKRVASERDRQFLGTGLAVKALANGTLTVSGSDYTLNVDSAFGIAGYAQPYPLFQKGERHVFGSDATGATLRNSAARSARLKAVRRVTATTAQLLYDGTTVAAGLAAAVADNDTIFVGDQAGFSGQGSSGENSEPQGLLAGIDDGNILAVYLNVTRTAQETFKAYVADASNAAWSGVVTEGLLNFADDECHMISGAKVDTLVTSVNANRSYWNNLKQNAYFIGQTGMMGAKDSPQRVMINGRPMQLRVCRKVPDEVAFGISTEKWKLFTLQKFEWDQRTGAIWRQVTDTTGRKDQFFAFGKLYEELACSAPWNNFRIDNISVSF